MRRTHQRGIAIGPILFIVAILAVLAAAIAAGSGSFNGDISAISAKAYATAILEYANEVKLGVDRVIAKGCTDTQISFENPIVSGYTNSNAPSDKSCHVFDMNGGGVGWQNPNANALSTVRTGTTNGFYIYDGTMCVSGVGSATSISYGLGTTCRSDSSPPSLVMVTHDVTPGVCDAIDVMLGVETPHSTRGLSISVVPGAGFTGSYNKNGSVAFNALTTVGKMMGCAQVDGNYGSYRYFYAVLIPR